MKVALDTNILAYAEGAGDEARRKSSLDLLTALPADSVMVPVQVLGELFRVLTGKRGVSRQKAKSAVLSWSDAFEVHESTQTALFAAFDLSVEHAIQIWDGLILSVAADARCRLLLTEDMQNGFTWRGVTVVNPYASPAHPLLTNLLRG